MMEGLFIIGLIAVASFFYDENQRLKKRINHLLRERKGESYDEK